MNNLLRITIGSVMALPLSLLILEFSWQSVVAIHLLGIVISLYVVPKIQSHFTSREPTVLRVDK